MKRKLIVLIMFTIANLFISCNNKDEEIEVKESCKPIKLVEDDSQLRFEKTIIIYEDADYLIKKPLFNFISDMNGMYINYEEYLDKLNEIVSDAKNKDILYAEEYFFEENKNYMIAHALETGNSHVFVKNTSTSLKELCLKTFSCEGPIYGEGGRMFYLNGHLFLKVIDFVC